MLVRRETINANFETIRRKGIEKSATKGARCCLGCFGTCGIVLFVIGAVFLGSRGQEKSTAMSRLSSDAIPNWQKSRGYFSSSSWSCASTDTSSNTTKSLSDTNSRNWIEDYFHQEEITAPVWPINRKSNMFELPWTTGSEDLYMKFNISWSPSPPNSSVRVEYPFRISKTFPKIALGCRTSSCSSYTSGSSAKKDCEKQPYCNEVCAQTKFNAQWNASSETCSMNFYLKSVCLKSTRDTAGNYRMRADSACFLHPGGISVYNFDLSKFNSFYHSEFPYIPQDDGSPAFYHFIRPTNGVQMEIRDSNDPIFFVANATSNSYTFSSTVDDIKQTAAQILVGFGVFVLVSSFCCCLAIRRITRGYPGSKRPSQVHGIPMPSPTIAYPVSASAAMQPQTLTTYDTSSYLPPHASSTTQLQPSQPPYPVAQTPVYNYPPVAHSPVPVAPVTVTAAPYPDPNAQNRPVTPVSAPVPSLQPIPLTRPLSVFAPQFPSSYPSNQGQIPYPTPALSQSPGTGAMNPIAYPPQPGQPIYPGAANPIPYPQPQSQPHPNPLPMNPQNAPNPYQPSASNAPPYPTPPYPPSQQTYPAPQQNHPGSGQNPPPYFSAMPPVTTNAVPYPQMQMPSPMILSSSAEPPMSPHSAPSAPPL